MDCVVLGSSYGLHVDPYLHFRFLDLLMTLSQCGLQAVSVIPPHTADVLQSAMCLLIKSKKRQQLHHFCTYWKANIMERGFVLVACFFPCLLFLPLRTEDGFSSIQTS